MVLKAVKAMILFSNSQHDISQMSYIVYVIVCCDHGSQGMIFFLKIFLKSSLEIRNKIGKSVYINNSVNFCFSIYVH